MKAVVLLALKAMKIKSLGGKNPQTNAAITVERSLFLSDLAPLSFLKGQSNYGAFKQLQV